MVYVEGAQQHTPGSFRRSGRHMHRTTSRGKQNSVYINSLTFSYWQMSYFSKSELTRALSEVKYGIIAYRVLEDLCDAHQAVSEVELLEKRQIEVKLTARGYEVGYLGEYYFILFFGR